MKPKHGEEDTTSAIEQWFRGITLMYHRVLIDNKRNHTRQSPLDILPTTYAHLENYNDRDKTTDP